MARIGKLALILITLSLFRHPAIAQEVRHGLTWYTDINQAAEISNKTKKPIFGYFTGSDWCGWCHRLERNVFEKPGFQAWARQHVVLVELDFPRNKKLPDALASQNAGLQQFFQVQGYPTIWIFNLAMDTAAHKGNIAALGSLSYPQSQPGMEESAFLSNANEVLKTKK